MKNNKTYKQMYDELIQFRQNNIIPQDQLGENHHIKPKSLFPELINDKNNIVRLKYIEHFFAHLYLYLYYKQETNDKHAQIKMGYALEPMLNIFIKCNNSQRIENIELVYEELKTYMAENKRNDMIEYYEQHPEERIKRGEESKQRWEDEEYKKRVIKSMKTFYKEHQDVGKIIGNKISLFYENNPDERKRVSTQTKERWDDENKRYKLVTAMKEAQKKPEVKKRKSEILKDRYKDPLKRQQMIDSIKNSYKTNPERKEKFRKTMMSNGKKTSIKPILQFTLDGQFVREWECSSDITRELGFNRSSIFNCVWGKTKSSHKYKWIYKEEYLKNTVDTPKQI